MKFRKYFLLTAFLLLLVGCALPPPDTTRQNFVPENEVLALRLTREGISFIQDGRYLDGEVSLRKALYIIPNSEKIKLNLGVSFFMQERFDEALDIFEDLHSKDPENISYTLWLAKTYIQAGAFDEGRDLIEAQTNKELSKEYAPINLSNSGTLQLALSNAYFARGQFDLAICASGRNITYSQVFDATMKYIVMNMQAGNITAAKWFLETKLAVSGVSNIEYHIRLSEVYLLLNDLEKAKEELITSLARFATDPEVLYERKLLTYILGKRLVAKGEEVDLSVFDSDVEEEILADPRVKSSPIGFLVSS